MIKKMLTVAATQNVHETRNTDVPNNCKKSSRNQRPYMQCRRQRLRWWHENLTTQLTKVRV